MGKGAPLRWIENQILRRHLRGRGIEIGALWKRSPVGQGARVWYVDRFTPKELSGHYMEVRSPLILPNVVAEANALPFRDQSLDFIIASHVLEHLPFPLAALRHWHKLLAANGSLLLRVPDKRYTFDRRRQRTPLEHLVREDSQPEMLDRRAHFEDWVRYVVGEQPSSAAFIRTLEDLMRANYSIHYHVWVSEDIEEIIEYTRNVHHLSWSPAIFWRAAFYRKETVALLRKTKPLAAQKRLRDLPI